VLERLLDAISYEAPDQTGKRYTIDAAYVDAHLAALVQDQDLSRYIL
jgi:ATP-dependent HslUV protease ATP-binding subunit HslU